MSYVIHEKVNKNEIWVFCVVMLCLSPVAESFVPLVDYELLLEVNMGVWLGVNSVWLDYEPVCLRVFVGNLCDLVCRRDLMLYFGKYGVLLDCKVVCDKVGNSRGYGFLEFYDKKFGELAVANCNKSVFFGRSISVMVAHSQ